MVCEHTASLRAQTQSSMTTVGSNTASVWQCSSYKRPAAAARTAARSQSEMSCLFVCLDTKGEFTPSILGPVVAKPGAVVSLVKFICAHVNQPITPGCGPK